MLTFLDRDFLFKLILALLVYSLVPLGEIFLFVYIGSLIGNYLILILAALVGVAGAMAGLGQVRRTVSGLRELLARGGYAGPQLVDLAGLILLKRVDRSLDLALVIPKNILLVLSMRKSPVSLSSGSNVIELIFL